MARATVQLDKSRPLSHYLKRDSALYVMLAFPVLIALIFRYVPIVAMVIAFKEYNFVDGIFGSEWAGLKWFDRFFSSRNFNEIFTNTLKVSISSFLIGFPMPIILALSLNEVPSARFKRSVQIASYLPYFISTVIVVGMMNQILSPTTGIVNNVINNLGGSSIQFATTPKYFIPMYVISGIWSGMGYSSIIYLSALSGISAELYEAAIVDGAGRWQKIRYITLPGIMPTIGILFLMSAGSLFTVGFEKALLMQNNLNISASEVIGTYVYKQGLVQLNYSYSTAIDIFQGVLNFTLLALVNGLARKYAEISLW